MSLLPVVAQLWLSAALLFADRTVTAKGHVSTNPTMAYSSVRLSSSHNLLAWHGAVGPSQARFVRTQTTAVTKGSLKDMLRADAAVRRLVEEISVVPSMFAFA